MSTFKLPSKFANKSIEARMNASLPSLESLVKTLAGHELCTKIVGPFAFAANFSDREMIGIAVNNMVRSMTGTPFSGVVDQKADLAFVYNHEGNEFTVNIQQYEAMLKIMFCSWLQIPFLKNGEHTELYYEFKSNPIIWKVLD